MKFELPAYYDKLRPKERAIVRSQYVKLQNNLCYWCKKSLDESPSKEVMDKQINKKLFPKYFFNHPVHLDHSHSTGLTRGAVHARCNAVMWQYYGR